MNEEPGYVVSPDAHAQVNTGISGGSGQNSPKPPQKPSKFLEWIKSHKFLSVALVVMAGIIILVGSAAFTKQKISLFGLELNPFYDQASCAPPTHNENGDIVVVCDGALTIHAQFTDGQVGVPYANSLTETGQSTEGVCAWTLVSIVPNTVDGAAIIAPESSGATARFTATPKVAGTYQVTIKLHCGSQEVTQTFPWTVSGATSSNALDIKGDFSTTPHVGSLYSIYIETVNAGGAICKFSLGTITPELPGAYIDDLSGFPDPNARASTETKAAIRAVLQNPGDYHIPVSVICNPKAGNGPSQTVKKEFTLTVKDTVGQPPGNTGIDVVGDFPDGTVDKESKVTVHSVNAGDKTKYYCRVSTKQITPAISGVTIFTSYSDGDVYGALTITPKTAGNYVITIHAICENRDIASYGDTVPAIVFNKDFAWKVNSAVVTGGTLDIAANFTDSTAGAAYSTNIKTVNGKGRSCTLALEGVTPNIPGAAVVQANSVANTDEASGSFGATPTIAGTYTVSLSATCNPTVGLGHTTTFKKDFTWKVSAGSPTTSDLGIDAKFADGKINQAYSAAVKTINGSIRCNLGLVKVNPVMPGATFLNTVTTGTPPADQQAIGAFTVTPKTAGTYTVTLSADCPPPAGTSGPTKHIEKDFPFTVTDSAVTVTAHPNGTLVTHVPGDSVQSGVFLVENGKRWPIGSMDIFNCLGYKIADIAIANDADAKLPVGAGLTCDVHGNGSLVINIPGENNVTGIYKIENGKRRPIGSSDIFTCLGLDWNAIVPANPADAKLPVGDPLVCTPTAAHGNGTLVTHVPGDPVQSGVFRIENGKRRPIGSMDIFNCLGYKVADIVIANVADAQLPLGDAMTCSAPTSVIAHPEGTLVTHVPGDPIQSGVFRIENGKRRPIGSTDIFNCLGYKVADVVNANSADALLPLGDAMTCSTPPSGGGGGSTAVSICKSQKSQLIPIYRYWSRLNGDHFFTTIANEKPNPNYYVSEGISGYVFKTQVAGSVPIYRSFKASIIAHYYSTTDDAPKYGYTNEGIIGYGISSTAALGTLPWYRLHLGDPTSDYVETISTKEKAEILAKGYSDEGIVANICESNT